jgi:hypothetical protein
MSPVVAWVVVTIVVNFLWGSQILMAYPSRSGRSGFSLHRTGRMAMLHGLRGQGSHMPSAFFYFWSRARPEIANTLLSGLFLALHRS